MSKNLNKYFRSPILDGLELLNAKSHTLDFPFHTHDTFNIALILDNTFNTKLATKFLKAPAGTLSITNPDEVHATPCDELIGNSFFTYYVSPEALKTFNNGQTVFFEDKIVYDQALFAELYALSLCFQDDPVAFELRFCQAMKELVSKHAALKPYKRSTTELFQRFIAETNIEKFSVEKAAAKFGINKFKFIRLFKCETGLTPNHYVLLKKIEESKKMLKEGNPIIDAALATGFYDTSHFYKYFKRFVGVNPMEFRKALLKE